MEGDILTQNFLTTLIFNQFLNHFKAGILAMKKKENTFDDNSAGATFVITLGATFVIARRHGATFVITSVRLL